MLKNFSYSPSDSKSQYSICFGNSLIETGEYLTDFIGKYTSYIYIVDKNLPKKILNSVTEITGVPNTLTVYVDPTEKNIDNVVKIWNAMTTYVPAAAIIIGGGSTGDMSGMACGNYQRGIPRIFFPTTSLAMVDASIGGKSSIDHNGVKNSVGLIHYPDVVVNYIPFLETLSDSDFFSGFAEIIKAATLYSKDFFNKLELLSYTNRAQLNEEALINIFYESASIKAKVCEEPNNRKKRLLYGHAVGHAYEKMSPLRKHGDCVAIGMNIEAMISVLHYGFSIDDWKRQNNLIKKFELPDRFEGETDLLDLIYRMGKYKQLVDSDNYFLVLPRTIGRVVNQDQGCVVKVPKEKMQLLLQESILNIKKYC